MCSLILFSQYSLLKQECVKGNMLPKRFWVSSEKIISKGGSGVVKNVGEIGLLLKTTTMLAFFL